VVPAGHQGVVHDVDPVRSEPRVTTDMPVGEKSRTVPVTGEDTRFGFFPLRTVKTT